jgi:hypothetical protein
MKALEVDHFGFTQKLKLNNNILIDTNSKNDGIRIFTHRNISKKEIDTVVRAF